MDLLKIGEYCRSALNDMADFISEKTTAAVEIEGKAW
jgi:hypothetical protein